MTYGSWNDNSVNHLPEGATPPADGIYDTDKSGTTVGMSVETWF